MRNRLFPPILREDPIPVDVLGYPFQSYRIGPGTRLLPKTAGWFFSSLAGPLPNKRSVVVFLPTPSPPPLSVLLHYQVWQCPSATRAPNDIRHSFVPPVMYKEFLQSFKGYAVAQQVFEQEELETELPSRTVRVTLSSFLSERYQPNERQCSHWILEPSSPRSQHKHRDLDATVFLGGGLFHSSSEGTTTVLLVICPCVNLTTTSLSAFLFVVCSSSNS